MCSVLATIVKYLLFFVNLAFCLAGIALVGIGIAVLVNFSEIVELIPINVNLIPISLIVIGCIIFVISFFGCCGSVRESRCMLIMYVVCMFILAGLKIWLAVVIFQNLYNIRDTVTGWLTDAFNNDSLRHAFNLMEVAFRCCGTTGPEAYESPFLPGSCCANPINSQCVLGTPDVFTGCNVLIGDYFESFGDAIAAVIVTVIVVEFVAAFLALFLNQSITSKRNKRY